MHPFTIPPEISGQVAARGRTPHPHAGLTGTRTAVVAVDMQNAFIDPGCGHAVCAMAPAVVRDLGTVTFSDGRAATTDAGHSAALPGFHPFFGNALTVAECEAGFAAGAREMAA